jgi:hypothetical protein
LDVDKLSIVTRYFDSRCGGGGGGGDNATGTSGKNGGDGGSGFNLNVSDGYVRIYRLW